ncbi:RNA recognition motif domain-containing protein [Vibrio porteresiae]|uniref:RNA-binding protein n=1 Tax=Vibrio porteresiae DSM 19223 TaxID=1123496 RepID=A0ABZ0QBZ6_9VIBR|nr:RNA-binding protein [Vibrio porteresiae]WPC73992.1 RNA-binding protein [Vibrio porteresiae DSM 19223]
MNSKKSLLVTVVFALLGAVLFSQMETHAAVSFLIGVIVTFFICNFLSSSNDDVQANTTLGTTTLYVGNLPYKANESNVRDLFAEHGEVFAVRLMKDKRTGKRRGFGFVVMSSLTAEQAIEELNEADYMQRTLKVRVANDPKHPNEEDMSE